MKEDKKSTCMRGRRWRKDLNRELFSENKAVSPKNVLEASRLARLIDANTIVLCYFPNGTRYTDWDA